MSSGYVAAPDTTRNGLARNGPELRAMNGRTIAATWRFSLKATENDGLGQSFPVLEPNEGGPDVLLKAFVGDARAGRSTRVHAKALCARLTRRLMPRRRRACTWSNGVLLGRWLEY